MSSSLILTTTTTDSATTPATGKATLFYNGTALVLKFPDTSVQVFSATPDQTGNAGKFLSTDGTSTSWQPAGAGGTSGELQYNNGGAFGGISPVLEGIPTYLWQGGDTSPPTWSQVTNYTGVAAVEKSILYYTASGLLQSSNNFIFDFTGYPALDVNNAEININAYSLLQIQPESFGLYFYPGTYLVDYLGNGGTYGTALLGDQINGQYWQNVILKQVITTTGNDTINQQIIPEIYVILIGAQTTETLNFPQATFDGQVISIVAAANQTTLTMVPNGTDNIHHPLTTMTNGQYVRFIWNQSTSTWY